MSQKKNLPYVSDHTLNKSDPEAIVYRDADGNLIRLTEADFASREEYEKWKAWSDEDYAEIWQVRETSAGIGGRKDCRCLS